MMAEVNRDARKYCRRCGETVRWMPVQLPVENVREPIQFACIGGNTASLCGLREEQRNDA